MNPSQPTKKMTNYELEKKIKKKFHKNIMALYLSASHLSWQEIIDSRDWTDIEQLDLGSSSVTDTNLDAVLKHDWPKLNILWLYGNKITNVGVKKIVDKQWPSLKEIQLSDSKIGNEGLFTLLEGIGLTKISRLTINRANINLTKMNKIPQMEVLNLLRLEISQNQIGYRGAIILAKLNMPNLQDLYICSEGAKHLSKAKWTNIKSIHMGYNIIQLDGYLQLRNNTWMKLQEYYIQNANAMSYLQVFSGVNSQINSIDIELPQPRNRFIRKKLSQLLKNRFNKMQQEDDDGNDDDDEDEDDDDDGNDDGNDDNVNENGNDNDDDQDDNWSDQQEDSDIQQDLSQNQPNQQNLQNNNQQGEQEKDNNQN